MKSTPASCYISSRSFNRRMTRPERGSATHLCRTEAYSDPRIAPFFRSVSRSDSGPCSRDEPERPYQRHGV